MSRLIETQVHSGIAHIILRLSGHSDISLYDYHHGKHRYFHGTVSIERVDISEQESGLHFIGSSTDLYEQKTCAHIALLLVGYRFPGFDYHVGTHFSGSFAVQSVAIVDHKTNHHFHYRA